MRGKLNFIYQILKVKFHFQNDKFWVQVLLKNTSLFLVVQTTFFFYFFFKLSVDNDEWTDGSCAKSNIAGWWFNKCEMSNLNGLFPTPSQPPDEHKSMHWKEDKHSTTFLKSVKMMIRPVD